LPEPVGLAGDVAKGLNRKSFRYFCGHGAGGFHGLLFAFP
jgi:hypothetical protein